MTATTREGVFHFFALARELRDLIYEELVTATAPVKVTRTWSPKLRARAHKLPAANMLLLSPRFSAEYRSIVQKKTTLVVEDHFSDSARLQNIPIQLPRSVSGIRLILLEVYICPANALATCEGKETDCCTIGQDVALHMRWISDLLARLPQLTSLTINVHTPFRFGVAENRSALVKHVSAIATLPKLAAITMIVNDGVGHKDVNRWEYGCVEKEEIMKWERTTGEFRDVEA
ncbi:hypothetical protein B0A55_04204 [Friedmanniomyces simplex]|uniref:Uncharacterized protein n=1 Tax=Friedmanniomyces simplex TaxID=329884 RepID=A0A4U0XGZ8_9PEZI|nr:hypothetical protein B0A55_04204 [Friedmanniomyces simplex]